MDSRGYGSNDSMADDQPSEEVASVFIKGPIRVTWSLQIFIQTPLQCLNCELQAIKDKPILYKVYSEWPSLFPDKQSVYQYILFESANCP